MTNALSKASQELSGQPKTCQGSAHTGQRCWNCSIWVSPVWRWQKSLGAMLCNACAICYKTKGHQRAQPSQEELERTAAAYLAKQSKPAKQASTSLEPVLHSSQSTQDLHTTRFNDKLGKRKRQPKEWGQEVVAYGETDFEYHEDATQKSEDSSSSIMDLTELTDNYANSYDSLPHHDRLDTTGAAEVLVSLKSTEYPSDRRPKRHASAVLDRPVATSVDEGEADVKVVLTVRPGKKAIRRVSGGPDRKCVECGATETPTWRKAGGTEDLCNACGVQRATLARKHSMKRQGSVNSRPRAMPQAMHHVPAVQPAYMPQADAAAALPASAPPPAVVPAPYSSYAGDQSAFDNNLIGRNNNPSHHSYFDTFNYSQQKPANCNTLESLRFLNRDNFVYSQMPLAAQPAQTVMKRKRVEQPNFELEKPDQGSKRALFAPIHINVQTF